MALPTKADWLTALEKRQGKELVKKLQDSSVVICGLGGLGSNIALTLARAGVGKLCLIDFDKVDLANLNRQQYTFSQIGMFKADALKENIRAISPYTEIITHNVRIDDGNIQQLVRDYDIVCEAFDKAENKAMLVNTVLERFPEKYLVSGSGMAGLNSANDMKTRKITNRFYLCGDGVSDISDNDEILLSRVLVCASHQAHTIIRIIAGEFDA